MSNAGSSPSGQAALAVSQPSLSPNLQPTSAGLGQGTIYPSWTSSDPRSSSTQSLAPSESSDVGPDARRTLLLVYIHGFMGNDSSFRSFPAHVHNFLKNALFDSHVIHSKIYPRYKTYKSIDIARDNFSAWLEPHESDTTDVILIGHSMGGLLAADVVLIPNDRPNSTTPFKHRILGTISMDSPFLGLHPGIIVSGIASLFRPSPKKEGDSPEINATSPDPSRSLSPESSIYSDLSPPPSGAASTVSLAAVTSSSSVASSSADSYYNPPFFNDVLFQDRGWFRNVAHFAQKHRQENLVNAAANHIMSHLEFGGCLADYPGLNSRYEKLRRLEDVDDLNLSGHRKSGEARVRFANYYTISTGRPKTPKPQSPHLKAEQPEPRRSHDSGSHSSTPRISIEDRSDQDRPVILQEIEPQPDESPAPEAAPTEPGDPPDHDAPPAYTELSSPDAPQGVALPPIAPLPEPPNQPDLDSYPDAESRKQAEKEGKRAQKTYEQAVKDREKAIKERQKLIEKMRRKTAKEAEKKEKDERKRQEKEEQALQKEAEQAAKAAAAATSPTSPTPSASDKKKKERKFCMLPRKVKDKADDTWIMVYMKDMDEVGAHCGLFIPGPQYGPLVHDVGGKIVEWVQEDATRRAIKSMQ